MHASCIIATMVQTQDLAGRINAALAARGIHWKAIPRDDIGISYQGLKKAVEGGTQSMDAGNCVRLARFLGVNTDWLATGEGPMQRESDQTTPFDELKGPEVTLFQLVRGGLNRDELINLISVISDAVDTKRDSVNPDQKAQTPTLYFGLERRTNEGGVRVPKGEENWTEGQYVSDPKTRRTDRGNHK